MRELNFDEMELVSGGAKLGCEYTTTTTTNPNGSTTTTTTFKCSAET